MPKTTEQWLLYKYVGGVFTPLSKPFKTKQQAEKARRKYPEKQRKSIGVGLIRTKRSVNSATALSLFNRKEGDATEAASPPVPS